MNKKKSKLSYCCYRMIKGLIWLLYPKITTVGTENLPKGEALLVGNHCQMHGPIACELYFPGNRYTWCAGEMMHLKEVPAYAYQDFWSGKPKYIRWFYKLLSYIVAPLAVCVFQNANTVAVYKDSRVLATFKHTVNCLNDGAKVVVFPAHYKSFNHIINDFQDKFVDIARLYYKRTGKRLAFIPQYLAPSLKKLVIGKPIYFDPDEPMESQRARICTYLKEQITIMALDLPPHLVVPYPNMPKSQFPMSK